MTLDDIVTVHARAMTVPKPWGRETFEAFIASPGAILTCAGAAFALGRVIADEAELLTLAVDPPVQRHGLGRVVLTDYERKARSKGAVRGHLEVAATNEAARALYAAQGYAAVGRRRGYYVLTEGGAIDAITMSRALDD